MSDYASMTNEELCNRLVNRVEYDVIHEADDYSQGVKDIRAEFQRRDAELARLRAENATLRQRCDVLDDQAWPGTRGLE